MTVTRASHPCRIAEGAAPDLSCCADRRPSAPHVHGLAAINRTRASGRCGGRVCTSMATGDRSGFECHSRGSLGNATRTVRRRFRRARSRTHGASVMLEKFAFSWRRRCPPRSRDRSSSHHRWRSLSDKENRPGGSRFSAGDLERSGGRWRTSMVTPVIATGSERYRYGADRSEAWLRAYDRGRMESGCSNVRVPQT